jgi:membrane fusion protein (multidrug efflux system)
MLVPQKAVSRDDKGQPTVLVVGPDNKLQPRSLQAPRTVGTNWLVTSGIKPGDRVVVEGAQVLQPGASVKPVPYRESADAKGSPSQTPQGK